MDPYTEINVVDVFVQPINRMLSLKYHINSSPFQSLRSGGYRIRAKSVQL
jgi:DNA-binding response OmpR family regulator